MVIFFYCWDNNKNKTPRAAVDSMAAEALKQRALIQ